MLCSFAGSNAASPNAFLLFNYSVTAQARVIGFHSLLWKLIPPLVDRR